MKLSGDGRGPSEIGRDAERGLVVIDHICPCGRKWLPVLGSFVIIPEKPVLNAEYPFVLSSSAR
jgi:hypothetical protein